MASYLSTEGSFTPAEISACAHAADRLLRLGERELAISVVEAIYCMLSHREARSPARTAARAKLTVVGGLEYGKP